MTSRPRLDQVQQSHHDLSRGIRPPEHPQHVDLSRGGQTDSFDLLSQASVMPAFEELLDTYMRNFTGLEIPKSKPVNVVHVHVLLRPEELDEGTHIAIQVPTFGICPCCGGSGRAGFYVCDLCQGEGFTERMRTARVPVPPQTTQGTQIPVSLNPAGVENLYLNVGVYLLP